MKNYLIIEDVDGELLPRTIIANNDKYGFDEVESKLQEGDKVVEIKIVKVREIKEVEDLISNK